MKKSIRITFYLSFLIPVIFSSCSSYKAAETVYMTNNTSCIKEKILKIENGLLPAVLIENEDSITYSIIERMQYYDVPGLSIAVIKDNKIEWAKSYGVKEKGTTDIVTLNTMFQAASMSKPITGIVAVKLAEQGKIDLYKSVNEQLKSWQIPENEFTKKKAVTPELLLLHLGGLNVHGYHGYSVSDTIPNIIDILNGTGSANSESMEVVIEPRTKWIYSGGGYTVLQLLMEEVSGKSFPQLMKENLFDPLEIKNSTFSHNLSKNEEKSIAKAYRYDGSMVKGGYHIYPEKAAAGLWCTPSDYAKMVIEIQKAYFGQSNKIVSQEASKSLFTRNLGYMGYGFMIRLHGDSTAIAFGGGNKGYTCNIFSYFHQGSGAVIMANSDNAEIMGEILRSMSKQYSWPEFKPKTMKAADVSASTLLSYVGTYNGISTDSVEFTFEITLKDNCLYSTINNKTKKLYAKNEKEFIIPERDWKITFKDTDGKIDSLEFYVDYENGTAKRINLQN